MKYISHKMIFIVYICAELQLNKHTMTSIGKETESQLNALLQKAEGSIANLTVEEKQMMQRLISDEVAKDYKELFAVHYPRKAVIAALLMEETHKRRMNLNRMCDTLGMTREHFSKILSGKSKLGLHYAQAIHQKLQVDANFILENI